MYYVQGSDERPAGDSHIGQRTHSFYLSFSFFMCSPLPHNSPHAPFAQIVFQKPVTIPCFLTFSMMAFLSFPLM